MLCYNNLTILEINIINLSKNLQNIPIQIVTNDKDFIETIESNIVIIKNFYQNQLKILECLKKKD